MSEESPKPVDSPKAVFKCTDKNCTTPHYHIDPEIEKLDKIAYETEDDLGNRPQVEVIPNTKPEETTP